MATPNGARHRDLEQRLRDLEHQVRQLTGATLSRRQVAVDADTLAVTSTGHLAVSDGGRITGTDSANTVVLDAGGPTSVGLSRPYLPWVAQPIGYSTTTSATWEPLLEAHGLPQHPNLRVVLDAYTDMGVSGRFRVGFTPDPVAGTPTTFYGDTFLPAGTNPTPSTVYTVDIPTTPDYTAHGRLTVEVRRESGAVGDVGVRVVHVTGTE